MEFSTTELNGWETKLWNVFNKRIDASTQKASMNTGREQEYNIEMDDQLNFVEYYSKFDGVILRVSFPRVYQQKVIAHCVF